MPTLVEFFKNNQAMCFSSLVIVNQQATNCQTVHHKKNTLWLSMKNAPFNVHKTVEVAFCCQQAYGFKEIRQNHPQLNNKGLTACQPSSQ